MPQAFYGFSGAAVYRVTTDHGTFALRQWRHSALNLNRLRGLHRLLTSIRHAGVKNVAVPIATGNGETFTRFDERYWQLEPWMPGTADYRQFPSRIRLKNAMAALADWHRAARLFEPGETEREWFRREAAAPSPAVRERLEKLHDWRTYRLATLQRAERLDGQHIEDFCRLRAEICQQFRRHADAVASELQSVCSVSFRLQPCLRDIWHDHVLFSGEMVTGIIDATACRTENVATDLARLLGSLVGDDAAAWRFALDAYDGISPLTTDEFRLIRILDRTGVLLSGLTWMDRYFLQRTTFANSAAVINRLQRIVERMRQL